ncbi:MAG: UDP-glucose 4-epimerase GalE [Alphaproteobacteria bacterium]|nr:MAG: UDP-glucose 4-epimerase GalE [Alphaproteobacteria bacterium]
MAEGKTAVLVTGGAGYIGSHAVLALLDAGWPVVVLDDLSTGFAWAVPEGAAFAKGDIADRALVARLIEEHRIGAIMHFAGSVVVPESVADPLKYYENNTVKSRALIAGAIEGGVRRFIFSSTAAVYGIPNTMPVAEDSPTAPINPYGASKLMTERMLADAAAAHPLSVGILRYFNVAGADPRGRAGLSTEGATHLVKVAVEAAAGKRGHVDIYGTDFDTPDGTGVRDYIHVTDLAEAHVRTLERLIARPDENLLLNCGYGHGFSVLEVFESVDRVAGRAIERRAAPRRAGDPPSVVADNRRILETLDWRPERDDLDTIVADALAWERKLASRLT